MKIVAKSILHDKEQIILDDSFVVVFGEGREAIQVDVDFSSGKVAISSPGGYRINIEPRAGNLIFVSANLA